MAGPEEIVGAAPSLSQGTAAAGFTVDRPSPAPEIDPSIADTTPSSFIPALRAQAPRSVLGLQTAATTETVAVEAADGRRRVTVSLIDLAPHIGAWYLVRVEGGEHKALDLPRSEFHLELRDRGLAIGLFEDGVVLGAGRRQARCELWGPRSTALAAAAKREMAFSRLCDGALYLRNTVSGHRTSKEWVADFLRDRVPGGERVTSFVKEELMQDAFLLTADIERDATVEHLHPHGAPVSPRLSREAATSLFVPQNLGLQVQADADLEGRLLVGRWYALDDEAGVYFSGLEPRHVSPDVVAEQGSAVSPLDDVERRALTYLVAFDLDRFEVDFEVGTDHPRVGWSERALPAVVDTRLPGPDGFDSVAPLARAGRVPLHRADDVVATFIGGFKRSHGAFKYGRLATVNQGSHYGFVAEGVILSSLQPELATALVWNDGTVELKTWNEEDNHRLGEVRHARQNGVPILELDPNAGVVRPGALVKRWGDGNWSGSQEQKFRTLRAGLCIQESPAGRFLIYGYFSSVTTSAMALVFQAYGCSYAMLLDMNALEHTYLAVYGTRDGQREVHHLDRGMSVLDLSYEGTVVPRFLAYSDNRDFFYLSRRK